MKSKNSLKYNRLLRNIPNAKNLKSAALAAGYAESTATSKVYSMRGKIESSLSKQGYNKQSLQVEFERIAKICEESGDYSLTLRALEAIQKYTLNDRATNVALFNLSNEDSTALRNKLHNKEVLSINSIETVEDKADSTAVDSVDDTTDEHSTEQGTESQVIDTNDDMVIEGRE